ncbi:MAG: hypothetical protein ACKPKO_64495, partial [Candidatus Fonsibacter sp.]
MIIVIIYVFDNGFLCVSVSENGRHLFCVEPRVAVYDDARDSFVVEVELDDFTHVYTSICGISLSMVLRTELLSGPTVSR